MIRIEVANEQSALAVNERQLRTAARTVLQRAGLDRASVSLAVVNDQTIQALNRQYLQHDEATDVLSFLLEEAAEGLEGEVVVSAETAARVAARYGWGADEELLLYVVHGALHLVGYDDDTPSNTAKMRAAEKAILAKFRLRPGGYNHPSAPHASSVAPVDRLPAPGKGVSLP